MLFTEYYIHLTKNIIPSKIYRVYKYETTIVIFAVVPSWLFYCYNKRIKFKHFFPLKSKMQYIYSI